jgi:predicted MFS family arabinose efflux permease
MAVSFPAGAVVGAALAIMLVRAQGWQSVFMAGGMLSLAAILVMIAVLPESVDFLLARRPANALARINRILGRLNSAPLEQLPPLANDQVHAFSFRNLLQARLRQSLFYVGAIMFLTMFSFYFILNWAPKLLVDQGQSMHTGISVGMLMNLGGMIGGVVVGITLRFVPLRWVLPAVLGLMAAGVSVYGMISQQPRAVVVLALALGVLMYGSMVVTYTLMLTRFPVGVRATCVGLVGTAGRLGSVLGPYIGGVLLADGRAVPLVCLILATPALMAALLAAWRESGRTQ